LQENSVEHQRLDKSRPKARAQTWRVNDFTVATQCGH